MTTTRLSRSVVLAGALILLGSCYRTAKDPSIDRRLTAIEQRLDAQDKAIAEMRSRADSTELSLLAQQIADVTGKVAELADKTAKLPAPRPQRPRPDPAVVYAVPLGASPVFGAPTAKVTLVMAFEFACPYCRRAWDTIDDLQKKYGKDLRVAYKQYVVHPTKATQPALAACAANHQNKFRALADLMWIKAFDASNFETSNIDAIAKQARLDMKKYKVDVAGSCADEVKADSELLRRLGVSATPTFFINGRFMEGAQGADKFVALIDEELAKATAAQQAGAKPETYYDDEVVAKGVTDFAP